MILLRVAVTFFALLGSNAIVRVEGSENGDAIEATRVVRER